MPRPTVPHHGPVTRDCPLACLLTVLSLNSYNPLLWADPRPGTVGDVLDLFTRHQLGGIRGIGPRRTSEIEAALVLAGLNVGCPVSERVIDEGVAP